MRANRRFHPTQAALGCAVAVCMALPAALPAWAGARSESRPGTIITKAAKAGNWWSRHGGFFYPGADPSRPAVLLIHGNHESARDWTKPSSMEQHYDYRDHPGKKRIGKKKVPNAGIYKVAASPWLEIDDQSWAKFLRLTGKRGILRLHLGDWHRRLVVRLAFRERPAQGDQRAKRLAG